MFMRKIYQKIGKQTLSLTEVVEMAVGRKGSSRDVRTEQTIGFWIHDGTCFRSDGPQFCLDLVMSYSPRVKWKGGAH